MHIESVTDLDEVKILGYFESLRGVFATKLTVLIALTGERDGERLLEIGRLPADAISAAEAMFPDDLTFKSLRARNPDMHANLVEDLVTSHVTASWNVFELIVKDLLRTDYVLQAGDMSANYQNSRFQFTAREKKDLELFYYIRNAIHHYNGAYYASKLIDHRYKDVDYVSAGHEGEKIFCSIAIAHAIGCDLERFALKAWTSAQALAQLSP
ncbi:hypothetical protein [Xanthomonas campestris]|uniref:hypothetical protein n=1 Tax=Xanthomonas campestris TaxID=339 RepID=UPI003CE7B180